MEIQRQFEKFEQDKNHAILAEMELRLRVLYNKGIRRYYDIRKNKAWKPYSSCIVNKGKTITKAKSRVNCRKRKAYQRKKFYNLTLSTIKITNKSVLNQSDASKIDLGEKENIKINVYSNQLEKENKELRESIARQIDINQDLLSRHQVVLNRKKLVQLLIIMNLPEKLQII